MDTPIDWLPTLLQNSDSLFPTGAYAHSSGLEEMVRLGVVTDEAVLKTFLQDQVIPALEHLDLPYARAAFEAGQPGDLGLLAEVSQEISAWKLCREAREASLQMGRGRLEAARKIFPHPLLEALAASSIPKHQIIVYGWQMASRRAPLESVLAGYFYQAMAGACSASLKLIRIGPEGAQRVLQQELTETGNVVASACRIDRQDAGWFSPMLEIAGMRHERAEERLFIS
ncbi:MAG TPA: urease accessory UreF family protein [Candidatus Methylacidiphilales bacterium]